MTTTPLNVHLIVANAENPRADMASHDPTTCFPSADMTGREPIITLQTPNRKFARPNARPRFSNLASARFYTARTAVAAFSMIGFLIRLAVSAAALLFISGASGGQIVVTGWQGAAVAALVLGLTNALVKPVLEWILRALTLPLSCLTLGLWSLVLSVLLNGFLFLVVAKAIEGFDVKTFPAAIVGALVMSGVNAVASALTKGDSEARRR